MHRLPPRLVLTVLLLAASQAAWAENWPHWRGPNRDGVCTEKDVPIRFGKTENVLWRLPLPGPAGATPVVWDDRVFLTTIDGDDLVLLCVGTDGKQRWRRVLGRGNRDVRGDEGNSASPSPCTDGRHVWAMFTSGDVGCYDVEGNEIWRFNVQERYGRFEIQFGMTPTPVLDGDRLYLQLIHSGGAKVVAIDALTGKGVWQQRRPSDAYAECEHSYASPQLYRDDEHEFLLTHGADYVVAHRLADGAELWRCGGLHPPSGYDPTLRFVASPLAVPGMIVVPSAKRGILVALKPDGTGNITDKPEHRHWTHGTTPDVPSPLVADGLVYLCRENGNLICLDAETGRQHYEQRTQRDRHRASPVFAAGHVYLSSRGGVVTVVKHGPRFEIVAENEMEEELSASPVFAAGRLYLRTFDALYAIGKE